MTVLDKGSSAKVAIITGGASGMGLATARTLVSRDNWHVHILDLNESAGKEAAKSLSSNATFHQVNVTSHKALGAVFKTIFLQHKRIDFVFANAGIAERANFYAQHEGIDPPPEVPGMDLLIDICFKAVTSTAYLALHYFRLSPDESKKERSLVITSSCGGIYPSYYSPIYTGTKHAVLGFMRSIAPNFYKDGIRVNAVLPGVVNTGLLSQKEWQNFPKEYFTPVEKIVEVVLYFVDGMDPIKGDGQGVLKGKAVECSGKNHYYREQAEYCDEAMRAVMASTDIEELDH